MAHLLSIYLYSKSYIHVIYIIQMYIKINKQKYDLNIRKLMLNK